MTVTGSAPDRRVKDKTLPVGETVVEEEGSSPSRTTVTRTVYSPEGEVIREETWNTSYKGETRVVRVGTKKPEPPEPPKEAEAARHRRAAGRLYAAPDSAVAIASASQSGTRVGRYVAASTTAWLVQASATSSPAARDAVLVAEARAAHVDAARLDREAVVERRGAVVAHVHLGRQRLDAARRGSPGSRRRTRSRYSTRATSSQTRNEAWCAIPCASVSAKRTLISVENGKPLTSATSRITACRPPT